jgi:hypothetical protein
MHRVLGMLRTRKHHAANEMELVNLRAAREGRDLTSVEQIRYNIAKQQAEDLAGVIHTLEGELDGAALAQITPNEPKRDRFLWMYRPED